MELSDTHSTTSVHVQIEEGDPQCICGNKDFREYKRTTTNDGREVCSISGNTQKENGRWIKQFCVYTSETVC